MEKSIETIWKEGFLQKDALVAPKINDLYNQKSMHVVEKFKRLGKGNLIGLVIGAVFVLLASFALGVPVTGACMFVVLIWLVLVGRRQATELKQINSDMTSYQYLKDFDVWLKASMNEYERIYRYAYPLLFLFIIIGTLHGRFISDAKPSIFERIMNSSDVDLLFGYPIVLIIPISVIMLLSAVFSAKLYKFDLDLVYGRVFRKIEELLRDMEELRK